MNKPKIDLTNKKFGKLTVLEYLGSSIWKCKCDCGNIKNVATRDLNSGHTKSCGCLSKEKNSKNYTIDMLNYKDENIKVLERDGSDQQGVALWKVKCLHCGNIFTTRGSSIRAGYVKSCGCVHSQNEQIITKMLIENDIKFKTQYTFPNLKGVNGGNLRFDFAIFNEDDKLSHLIEYNGKQHYFPAEGSWKSGFEDLQENDKRKIDFCKNNNIELRIIRYDEDYGLNNLI